MNFLATFTYTRNEKRKEHEQKNIVLKALSKTLYDGIKTSSFISDTHNAFEEHLKAINMFA